MSGKGKAASNDDCFARFDEAFARLESQWPLETADSTPHAAAPRPDLSEYEEAFSNIDRQLDGHLPSASAPPAPASPPPPARPTLALVSPAPGSTPDVPRGVPVVSALEDLWRHPARPGHPAERLVVTIQNLLWLHRVIQSRDLRATDRMDLAHVSGVLTAARELCTEWDLPSAGVRADFTLASLDDDKLDVLAAEIAELVRHMRHDLQSCSIWPVTRRRLATFDATLETATATAFPSATAELAEAARCAMFGLATAAAFHTIRAANGGRRSLSAALPLRERDSEPVDWASTAALLEARIADLTHWPAGPMRKAGKDFFTATLNDVRVLHAAEQRMVYDGVFDEPFAAVVLDTTRSFLDRLAGYLSERQPTRLTRLVFAGPTPRP